MGSVKHPLLAVTAAIAALVVGAASWGGFWITCGAVSVLVVAVALGWPQLLGAPARKSLSAVLGLTGLAAVWAVAAWPGQDPGEGPAAFGASLIEPVAVCMALGVVAAFMVQLFRGSGSPQRLESTAGTITGVAAACAGAGWAALARYDAGPLAVSVAVSLALAALAGMVPVPSRFPPRLRAVAGAALPVVLAGVAPWCVALLVPALPLPAAVMSGILGALVLVLLGLTAPEGGAGRPVGQRAAMALGVAPVAIVGLLTYFVFRIVPA
jgi:hypothetical protein